MSLGSSLKSAVLVAVVAFSSFEISALPQTYRSFEGSSRFHVRSKGPPLVEGDVYADWSPDKSYKQDPVDFFDPALRWNPEDVPYFIDPALIDAEANVTERIEDAITEFAKNTCIKFRALAMENFESWPIDYLLFNISADGCYSYIGRRGGPQPISLKPNSCVYKGIIMHEIFHSLGFGHEHNRPDRDEAIDIIWEFVDPAKTSYLNKYYAYPTYGIPYDYDSILHGNHKLYSVNDSSTLVAKPEDRNVTLGQREGLSVSDIRRLNAHYSCPLATTEANTESTSTTAITTTAAITSTTAIRCNGLTPSYADPEDCTKFYVCQGLRAIQMDCPSGLYYNSELYVCDWPWAVECDAQPSKAAPVLIF